MTSTKSEWHRPGQWYPDPDNKAACAAFDLLATHDPRTNSRSPNFEWGHETTPTIEEVWTLAKDIAEAVIRVVVVTPTKDCQTCEGHGFVNAPPNDRECPDCGPKESKRVEFMLGDGFQTTFDAWKAEIEKTENGTLEMTHEEIVLGGTRLLIWYRIAPAVEESTPGANTAMTTWKNSEARRANEVFKRRKILDGTVREMLTELEMLWDREGLDAFGYVHLEFVAFDKNGREARVEGAFGQMPVRSEIEVGPAPKSEFSKAVAAAVNNLRRRFDEF